MKSKIFLLVLLSLFIFSTQQVFANQKEAGTSAMLAQNTVINEKDSRVQTLKGFLDSYDSPLAGEAKTFVEQADKYNLDWRLVAAISGVESTFGHQLPYNSYNAWGWGIYGTNMIYFKSYDEAIATISASLREKYIDKWGSQDVYDIGRFYAASPTWASRVDYFMQQIDEYGTKHPIYSLSISL